MTDVWRHFHPSDSEFTCHSASHRSFSRIDLVYMSPGALRGVYSAEILSRGISDHAPVLVMCRPSAPEDPRMWRLSRYWIVEPTIQKERQDAVEEYWRINEQSVSLTTCWDAFKAWLRGEYAAHIALCRKNSVQETERLERDLPILLIQILLSKLAGKELFGS